MPIRPENKSRYPRNWPEISLEIRRRARWHCEQCGVADGALGGRDRGGRFWKAWPLGEKLNGYEWPEPGTEARCSASTPGGQVLRIIRIVLTVAHLDHTPENCDPANLKAWCQRCHLAYDAPHHAAERFANARAGATVGDLFTAEPPAPALPGPPAAQLDPQSTPEPAAGQAAPAAPKTATI